MKTSQYFAAVLVPLLIGANPAVVHADTTDATRTAPAYEENAQERINYSGKLRMLSQRIPAAACHLSQGIDVEGAKALLTGATAEFEQILTALEFGDSDLNIQNPETRRKTLFQIAAVRTEWEQLKTAAETIIADSTSDDAIDVVFAQNMAVLTQAQLLVEELVRQYSNPNAVSRASLMLIDIAGRQRMLTQKMSKESCFIASGLGTQRTYDDLAKTMEIFEASLEALRFGMPTVGILPPPTAEISDGLAGVWGDRNKVKPEVTDILLGVEIEDIRHVEKFQGLNVTMANMNAVVGLYAQ